jgi:hypothetical protein
MGYLIGTNGLVQKRSKSFVGMGYANPTLGLLSQLGGFGGWFCILPAAYFVGSTYEHGFLQGSSFCAAALVGAVVAGAFQAPGLNYLISALTLPANIGLAAFVYIMTRS